MNYFEFKNAVLENISEKMKGSAAVSLRRIQKNNGIYYDGLVIMKDNENVAPTFYLGDFYNKYQSGMELDDITEEIIRINGENCIHHINIDLFDFDRIRDNIRFKVINYDMNYALLKEIPHKKIMDLAVVFYISLSEHTEKNSSLILRNNHLEQMGIEFDTLIETAFENTQKKEAPRTGQIIEFLGMDANEDNTGFIVLTNASGYFGASCLFYDDISKIIDKEIGGDAYILPSSVHEVILVDKRIYMTYEELTDMVKEVNEYEVASEDILSSHVYLYDYETKSISLPTAKMEIENLFMS